MLGKKKRNHDGEEKIKIIVEWKIFQGKEIVLGLSLGLLRD